MPSFLSFLHAQPHDLVELTSRQHGPLAAGLHLVQPFLPRSVARVQVGGKVIETRVGLVAGRDDIALMRLPALVALVGRSPDAARALVDKYNVIACVDAVPGAAEAGFAYLQHQLLARPLAGAALLRTLRAVGFCGDFAASDIGCSASALYSLPNY